MSFGTRDYALTQTPLGLAIEQQASKPARPLRKVNRYLNIPTFSISAGGWNDSSHLVARIAIPTLASANFAFRVPIQRASVNFCPCVSYTEDGVQQRYKLWDGVGEKLGYPLYEGHVIANDAAAIEIWNVQDFLSCSIQEDWKLLLTELSIPTDSATLVGDGYECSTMCETFAGDVPTTIEEFLGRCNLSAF